VKQAKTLAEIRSDACNQALVIISVCGIPAIGLSLLRSMHFGMKGIVFMHTVLVACLLLALFRRHSLSLAVRAGLIIGTFCAVSVGGILTYGLGTGIIMFFVSGAVFAGCMFGRRVASILTGVQAFALFVFIGAFRYGLLSPRIGPDLYQLDVPSWIAIVFALTIAALVPIVAISAITHALDLERQRADAALEVRAQFLARMSHELRTPMTGIIGMADLLTVTRIDQQQRGMISRLTQSARSLLALLNDLLDFSKIDSGRLEIESVSFSISRVIADACELFEAAAAQKGLAFTVDMPAALQDRVVGDGYRLNQILTNLINNAVKFTEQGRITVRVAQVRRDERTVELTVSVADTGIGISAQQLGELFQPFMQVDVSTSRRYGGSGLGLVISRSLAQAMGGDIQVSSESGAGSTFMLRVPLVIDASPAMNDDALISLQAPPKSRPAPPLHILVAEDDATNRLLIVTMLEHLGHTVTAAEDGKAAVKAAAAGAYDAVIMDMRMPVMDGFDAVRSIRLMEAVAPNRARVPIIALTADLLPEHTAMFLEVGADVVVAKPVDWPAFKAQLDQIAAARPAHAAAPIKYRASR
jgi:signal transduction histidine kinase/ActR/RegA family two-component response regulator